MWAMILAGGLGIRIRHAHPGIPKALIPVAGQPFISYQIDYLLSQRVNHIVLLAGHLGDQMKEYFNREKKSKSVMTVIREKKQLDTAGAVRNACALLEVPKTFFLLNGDTYIPWQAATMLAAMDRYTDIVLTVAPGRNAGTGNIAMDAEGRITTYREKTGITETNCSNAGVYLLRRQAVMAWSPGQRSLEMDILPELAARRRARGVMCRQTIHDIGTERGLERFQKAVVRGELHPLSMRPQMIVREK